MQNFYYIIARKSQKTNRTKKKKNHSIRETDPQSIQASRSFTSSINKTGQAEKINKIKFKKTTNYLFLMLR